MAEVRRAQPPEALARFVWAQLRALSSFYEQRANIQRAEMFAASSPPEKQCSGQEDMAGEWQSAPFFCSDLSLPRPCTQPHGEQDCLANLALQHYEAE